MLWCGMMLFGNGRMGMSFAWGVFCAWHLLQYGKLFAFT